MKALNLRRIITTYTNPDLDGTACAYAYAEFLNSGGINAIAAIPGTPHHEARFVLNKFNIKTLSNIENTINENDEIVIVDASDPNGISDYVKLEKVVEIIDHRKVNDAHLFPNAKVQIELVGAAATLIAEKFYENACEISKESAALLFSAIVSNTINFQANVTVERDRAMAEWLKTKFELPNNYVHEMFKDKSQHKDIMTDLFVNDFASFNVNGYHLSVAQLEIIDVDKFIKENINELKENLKKNTRKVALDIFFITCIDLEKAFNTFVAIDDKTEKLVEMALGVKFINGIAKRKGILMRKEIYPMIKEHLES
ncbi:MAG: DHH family phosphoesterase [Patescibacteria group bacterium]|jgi:manganese-dependent inorganic pyrophosphatase|nr:DHH family phosphoesterase [Patescibacteria group bacterium]